MATAPTIEPMTRKDLRSVMAMDAKAYPTPWSRRLWLTELGRDQRSYLVARRDRKVVGYIGAMFVAEDVHVMTVVTHPDLRRQGLASRLLVATVQRALAAGCNALTLEVRAGNEPAQALYRSFGMVPVGVRRGYYEPDHEDALVMWVRNIDTSQYAERMEQIMLELEAVL